MIRRLVALVLFASTYFVASHSYAAIGVNTCQDAGTPFDSLVLLVKDQAVRNPSKLLLCNRAALAERHYSKGRPTLAVYELRKFILDVRLGTPLRIRKSHSVSLIAEARRIINLVEGRDEIALGQVSGGVFTFGSQEAVADAKVTLVFLSDGQTFSTQTDGNGLFSFNSLPSVGSFFVTADDWAGASGTTYGSILEGDLNESISIFIDEPGSGSIQGFINSEVVLEGSTLVTAYFPDSGREYSAIVGLDGTYDLSGLYVDGTVIVVAFDNNTGASASFSSVLTNSIPSRIINMNLSIPEIINPDLTNGGFEDGIAGWTVEGPFQIIDRNLVFDVEN